MVENVQSDTSSHSSESTIEDCDGFGVIDGRSVGCAVYLVVGAFGVGDGVGSVGAGVTILFGSVFSVGSGGG